MSHIEIMNFMKITGPYYKMVSSSEYNFSLPSTYNLVTII